MDKYLDLTGHERIVIQREHDETSALMCDDYLRPDGDLRRAISAQELLVGVEEDIRQAYRRKYGDRV